MKNQYIGDVGDYGKYALLREFLHAGVSVGINWYLTEKDDSTDGSLIKYLKQDSLRKYDPDLFDILKDIAFKKTKNIGDIEKAGILPNTVFHHDSLSFVDFPQKRARKREEWFERSCKTLSGTELIFMDPDNGLQVKNKPTRKGAEKYVMPDEVAQYYSSGHNVVYYCHKGRRTEDKWQEYLRVMRKWIPDVKLIALTYHKGTQRSYVFLIHEKDFARYRSILNGVLDYWDGIFTDECL